MYWFPILLTGWEVKAYFFSNSTSSKLKSNPNIPIVVVILFYTLIIETSELIFILFIFVGFL